MFSMRQLYEKSGSIARFSDFALDVRKIVEANSLPEYFMSLHRNESGDEIVNFLRRNHLGVFDPQSRPDRNPRRKLTPAQSVIPETSIA